MTYMWSIIVKSESVAALTAVLIPQFLNMVWIKITERQKERMTHCRAGDKITMNKKGKRPNREKGKA